MLKDDIQAMSRANQIKCESYHYSAAFNTLPVSGQLTVNINISNDSDFVVLATTLVSYSAASVLVVAPDYQLIMLDTSSGRVLMDGPTHVSNITGTGPWPFVWPEPYLFKGGGTIALTLINNTVTAALVSITLIGYKVFYLKGFNR